MAEQAEETEAEAFQLDVARVADMIAAGEVELIDVRRDYEHEAGHLANSRWIEMNDLMASAESIPRDGPVVFYCRTGNRSGLAAEAFRQAGYEAYNLAGGLVAWVDLEKPLEPEDGVVAEQRPI